MLKIFVRAWCKFNVVLRYTTFGKNSSCICVNSRTNRCALRFFFARTRTDQTQLMPAGTSQPFPTFEIRGFLPFYTLFARAFFLALLLANLVNIRVQTRGYVRVREIP